MSTWKELKERRLVQIVGSYAAAGWVVLSIVGLLNDREVLPEIVFQVLLVLYIGGMVIAAISGWYHGEKGHQKMTRTEIVLLVLVSLVTLGAGGLTVKRQVELERARVAAGEAGLELRRLAVLYFRDRSRGGELEYLADGITESLIHRLTESRGLDVLSENASRRFRDPEFSLDSIASALEAGTLVDGTVERRGDEVRVDFALHDGASGAEIQRGRVERPAEDLFALRDEVAEEVALLLGRWLEEEVDLRQARGGTESVVAWTLFRRGERARSEGEELLEEGARDEAIHRLRTADSLYAEAIRADESWASPLVSRGLLCDLLAQAVVRDDPAAARSWINAGIQYADRALALEPRAAEAHYVKGRLEYFRWRGGLAASPSESERAFRTALESMERATREEPSLAEAWSILSVLHSEEADNTEAKLAARRAFEEDEFLQNADEVLFRLYATSYDLEQMRDATQYCEEGRKRFPRHILFRECRLWLLAAPYSQALDPNPETAWAALDQYLEVVPPSYRDYLRIKGQILVAGTLGRAELQDSAEAVLARSRAPADLDPEMELMGLEALVRLHLGQKTDALDLLKTYLTANPHHREGWQWTAHWWWRPLQDDPEFRALVEG